MKSKIQFLKIISTLFFVLAIAYSPNVEGQILKKLAKRSKKAAEDAVVRKTEQKVYKETSKTMDTIYEGGGKKDNKSDEENTIGGNENENKGVLVRGGDHGNNENTTPSDDNTSRDDGGSNENLRPWSKYDFIPGDKIIFQDDLAGEESGEFPSRWDLLKGNAENASLGGENIINMDDKSVVTPLMENASYLPEVFTIEFDVYFDENKKNSYYQDYRLRLWAGTGSNQEGSNVYDPIIIYRNEVKFRTIKNGQVNEFKGNKDELNDKTPIWRHVAIAFNKRSLKVYLGQFRMLNIPNLGFEPKMFSIGGQSSQGDNDVNAIRNIRVAEGGKKLYDRIMADGKFVTRGILFDVNKANIKPESMGILNEIANMMKEHSDLKFSIEGHTDSDGGEAANLALSEKRAASVKSALVSLGIDSSRMETRGMGESTPVDTNATPEGKANNRRVEFIKI